MRRLRAWSGRTTSRYLMPSIALWRTSHSGRWRSSSSTSSALAYRARASGLSAMPSACAHVSRTGATTASDT
jgi:hypothetical protein